MLYQRRELAKEFNYEYFDGPRSMGLGDSNTFQILDRGLEDIIEHQLSNNHRYDVGCAKGFTMYEFARQLPGSRIKGIDISQYCINNALPIIAPHITHGCCSNLPYESKF